ncbi:hypothetical protein EDB92DRAFT_1834088 [Lactarius akahatsu]|uniref:Alcohol dehydrogenase-like N-terminal domain-containing protein n=1 Tax=Lactarius akahatsu TaxID=416441 RepID=A0AAD4LTW5_9AGAM|nr:hypothetical protein EDB92DRAFT_1834088 [Lactarius akahatsu]
MPKPTLLQTLLGRPSQTYSFPPEREYYSARDHLARAATANLVRDIPSPVIDQTQNVSSNSHPLSIFSDSDDSDDDTFHTPFSSPPISMLIDTPLSLVPSDPSPPHSRDDKSSSSSASSSSSHSASCSTSPTSDELHAALTALSKRAAAPSRSERVSPASKSYTYTDEDWAKEVRWLTQPAMNRRASLNLAQLAPNQPKPRPRPRTVVSRPTTSRRMTALLEEDEDATDDLRASPPPRTSTSAPLTHSNHHLTSSSHDLRPASQVSHARTTLSLPSRTVDLPQIPTAFDPPPAPGYTTLTLPRATYRPQDPWRALASGRIDLPRDGRAQHTMVSIEVVRGAASASFLRTGLRRRTSGPRMPKKRDLAGALALTSHRPPPSFVPNSHVLVQVHAVGLEGLDRQIVSDKLGANLTIGKGATGFVPGRGVLGRVVECGLEVSSDILRKGEWVIGLLDAKKCGALSEFVLLNRHHLHRAPQPTVPISAIIHPQSAEAPSFSLESLALLPLLGVPAYRAIQSYAATKSSLSSSSGTALVLRGQDGVGGLATLMLRAIGVNVIVQVEPSIVGLDASATATSEPFMLFSPSDDKALGTSIPRRLQEVCARLRAWGVEGICVGAPRDVLHSLDADVDFVLDTVGGREIWDAAHTLLARGTPSRGPAQFTTIVGDAGSGKAVPTTQDHWRAGVRSLKRAMTVRQQSPRRSSPSSSILGTTMTHTAASTRTVGYAWVSCIADVDFEGGDVRDALAALLEMPALQHPPLEALMGLGGEYGAGRVLSFERAPEAFGGAMLEGGGTAVIRVVL